MHSGQYGGGGGGVLIILKSNKKIEVTKNKVGV